MDTASPPPVQIVEADAPCTRCGYSLRGLSVVGKCPECSWAIEASLRGGLLRYAGPEYLGSLIFGAMVIVVTNIATAVLSMVAMIVAMILAFTVAASGGAIAALPSLESVTLILAVVASLASLVGYWQFTTPDPATERSEQPRAARRVVRASVVATLVVQVALLAVNLFSPGLAAGAIANPLSLANAAQLASSLLNLAGFVFGAVHFFAMMLFVRWLAMRIPDAAIVQQTRTYIWLLPGLYTVGALCIGIGPLVALVLYVVQVWRLRGMIVLARAESLRLAAA